MQVKLDQSKLVLLFLSFTRYTKKNINAFVLSLLLLSLFDTLFIKFQ